ncbi:cytochrome c oxidase subunit II [Vibrio harveyi]|uniref:cytochrome c oxidase subunit II n=1 Tax=Vibrio harveyi TaxID=669 RepID=UPI0036F2549F
MKRLATTLALLTNVIFITFSSSSWSEQSDYNMTRGVTGISEQVYELHMLIFYICCAIAFVVFGVMFYSIFKHRKSKGAVAANFHESTKVEIIWTVIPVIILIAMAIPATKTLVAMEDTSQSDLTVKITGSQWKWHYSYFGEDVEFFSLLATSQKEIDGIEAKGAHYLLEVDNPLVLPINRKVRFLMTSDDVIHSWWVPDFAVKKDTIPGFINEAWTKIDEPGVYRGQCAELCGRAHGFMPVVVHAMAEDDFDQWMADKKQEIALQKAAAQEALTQDLSMEDLMGQGESVYTARCAVCHQANGEGIPGAFPAIKGSEIAKGPVVAHIDVLVNGRAGTAMQAFANQLSDQEIAAVITYQRNAWGNDTGDTVQASDVNAFKVQESAKEEI